MTPTNNAGIHLFHSIKAQLDAMTDDQRMEFISEYKDFYCPHCGDPYNGRRTGMSCQCWNDE